MVFQCINIRQVPREVLKTEAEGTWQMLMNEKPMFDHYIKLLQSLIAPKGDFLSFLKS